MGLALMIRPYLFSILVAAGIFLTIVSGLLLFEAFYSPGGSINWFYGFPFPWKENIEFYCSPLHPQACQSPIYLTEFNWFIFGVDVLFYWASDTAYSDCIPSIAAEKPAAWEATESLSTLFFLNRRSF